MKKITNKLIKSHNPCEDRLDNFNKHYPKYSDTLSNFFKLDKITYNDKMWVIKHAVGKTIDIKILQQWSIDCAEFIVDNYNDAYPNDNTLNNCIKMSKKYLLGECSLDKLKKAKLATYSIIHSINSIAHPAIYSIADAAHSIVYSDMNSAIRSALYAIDSAECLDQENINLSLLIALL